MKLFSSSSALFLGTVENMFLTLILASITPMGGGATAGPSQPTNLTATVTACSKADLAWSASSAPNGSSVAGYKIFRNGTCIYTNTGATSYSDTTVVAPNNYSYTVSAVDTKARESAQSAAAGVSPCQDATKPSVPAGLNATAVNCSQVTLSWNAASDGPGAQYELVSGLQGYKVYRNGSFWQSVSTPGATDSGLAASTSYSYQVSAVDNVGNESALATAPVAVTPSCPVPPAAPASNVTISLTGTTNHISWAGTPGAPYQVICAAGFGGPWVPVDVPTTAFALDSLAVQDAAIYRVALFTNTPGYLANAAANMADTIAPSVPGNLTVSMVSTSEVDLAWDPSTDTGGSGLAYYFIYRDGLFLQSAPATATNSVDTLPPLSDTALYGVAAVDNAGNISAPATNSVALRPACSYTLSPSSASMVASGGSGNVSVSSKNGCSWSASSGNSWIHTSGSGNGNGSASYTVDQNTSSSLRSGSISIGNGSNLKTFTVTQAGAAPSCTYSLSSGTASFGSSGGSASVTVTTASGCSWTASTTYGWLHTTSSGTGSGTLSFSADANTSSSPITGTITVGNGANTTTLTVTVAGVAPTCTYSLSSGTASFGSSGGSSSVTVTTASGCTWTASTIYSWLHTTSSGTGSGTVSFSADANTSSSPVTGTITVGNGANTTTLTVTVAGVAPTCTYSLSSGTASFGSGGGSANVTVTTGSGCTWSASTAYSWLHTTSSGTGSGTLSFTVDPNTSTSPLTGTITVGSGTNVATLTVSEDAATPTCTYSLSSGTSSFPAGGGSGSVTMTATAGCSWTASTTYPWLHTSSSGSGNGTVFYTVDSNASTSSRSGTIVAGGQTLTVNQAGTACSYSLSSSNASYSSAGGSGAFNVTAGTSCLWAASTTYGWLHTTSSGSGNGTVSYSVDPNASLSPLTGTVTVAGLTFTVNQSGNQPPVANAGSNLTVTNGSSANLSGAGSYDPDGSIVSYQWNFGDSTTGSGVSVSHIYAGVGSYTVTLTVTDNLGATGASTALVTVVAAADTTPPTVSLTAPANSSTVSSTISVTANASDTGSGVASVQFYRDSGVALGSATVAPYSVSCDTTTLANGSHTFYATATDRAGNSATSASVTVTVNNNTTQPPGTRQWAKVGVVTSAGGQARTFGVATDRSGNVLAVGSFRGTVDFGSGPVSSSSGSFDIFIVKYDVQGNVAWVKQIGNTWDDGANAVAIDSQNNIIVTGYFGSTVDFGGTLLTATTPVFGTMPDIFVAKYSTSGALLWAKGFGGSNGDTGFGVAVDGTNNIFVGGTIASSDALFGSISLATAGSSDLVLTKLSSSGGVLWAKRWGSTGSDQVRGVAVDRSGDLLVSGQVATGADLGGGASTSSGIFVAKYSGVDGSYRWAKVVGPGTANGVAADPTTGNAIVTGNYAASADFGGGHVLSPGGIFLAAYDSTGNCVWAQTPNYSQFGFSANDMGSGVSVDSSGNIAMTGQVISSVSFDANSVWYGGGIQNYFTASYTGSGVYRWATRSSDTYASAGNAVAFDTLGHVVSAGYFYSTIDLGGLQFTTPVNTVAPLVVQYSR